MKVEFPSNEKVHCLDLSSGHSATGFLKITGTDIGLELHRYDGHFNLNNINPFYVRTEYNDYVSLFGVATAGSGTRSGVSEEETLTVHTSELYANIALVGEHKWALDHKVKVSKFSLPFFKETIEDTKEYKNIAYVDGKTRVKSQIFSISAGSILIRSGCNLSWRVFDDYPTHVEPYLEIEFPKGIELDEQYKTNQYLSSFWSLILGYPVLPKDVVVSDLTQAGLVRAINKGRQLRGYYKVFYRLFEKKPPETRHEPRQVLFYGKRKIHDIKHCLKVWMLRQKEWESSSELMLESLYYSNEISADRLLTACRWFEELPVTGSEQVIGKEDVDKIAEAATTKAEELGYSNSIKKRVKGSVSQLRSETHNERFVRLCGMVIAKFGEKLIDEQFLIDLGYAIRYRGLAAHGLFKIDDHQERHNAYRGMLAMEILCTLLTLLNLPISKKSMQTFKLDERIQQYRRLYVELVD